jgi:hypothetical protein
MIKRDLESARRKWLGESKSLEERKERMRSDFLSYCDHNGLYADFHTTRHGFITSLERAGITPKMAQTLARHSDVRLTLGVYTHVGLQDRTATIGSLPGPPGCDVRESDYGRRDALAGRDLADIYYPSGSVSVAVFMKCTPLGWCMPKKGGVFKEFLFYLVTFSQILFSCMWGKAFCLAGEKFAFSELRNDDRQHGKIVAGTTCDDT